MLVIDYTHVLRPGTSLQVLVPASIWPWCGFVLPSPLFLPSSSSFVLAHPLPYADELLGEHTYESGFCPVTFSIALCISPCHSLAAPSLPLRPSIPLSMSLCHSPSLSLSSPPSSPPYLFSRVRRCFLSLFLSLQSCSLTAVQGHVYCFPCLFKHVESHGTCA